MRLLSLRGPTKLGLVETDVVRERHIGLTREYAIESNNGQSLLI